MKKFQAILSLVLIAALLVMLFAACTNSNIQDTDTNTDNEQTNSDTSKEPVGNDEEEPVEITYYMYDFRRTGELAEAVEEAVRKIALEEANVIVDIEWCQAGNWQNAVLLPISSGEVIDVIQLSAANGVSRLYANGQLLDITDYMAEYASETMELVRDYVGPFYYGGRLYGVPTLRNFCKNGYLIMNAEVLDRIGMREMAQNMTTWSEYEQILEAVYNEMTVTGENMWPQGSTAVLFSDNYISRGDKFADYDVFDNLGDGTQLLYCSDDGVVSTIPDQPHYVEELERVADWAARGWIWPDSAIAGETQDALMKQKILFSVAQGTELGVEATKSSAYGYEVVAVKMTDGMIKTSQPISWGTGVPITCKEPEAACRFINLLYTNSEVMNLLVWGVEGKDYNLSDDGLVVQVEGSKYYEADFIFGNNLLLTPLFGNGTDFYDRVMQTNANSVKSRFLGFSIDTSDLDLVLSQVSAVTDQYMSALHTGGYSPEMFAEYKAKLDAAGIYTYVETVQIQLDAWLANN